MNETPLLTQSEAQAITDPFHEAWVSAHLDSWEMWSKRLAEDPVFFKPLREAERYSILHRHICDHAASALDGRVTNSESLKFFAQIIGNSAIVRFKHVDRDLRPTTYRTDQQDCIDHQEFSPAMVKALQFDGVAMPMTFLTVGFTLALGEEAISRVAVICRTPKLRFHYDIYNIAGEQACDGSVEVSPFPGMPSPGARVRSTRPSVEEIAPEA